MATTMFDDADRALLEKIDGVLSKCYGHLLELADRVAPDTEQVITGEARPVSNSRTSLLRSDNLCQAGGDDD